MRIIGRLRDQTSLEAILLCIARGGADLIKLAMGLQDPLGGWGRVVGGVAYVHSAPGTHPWRAFLKGFRQETASRPGVRHPVDWPCEARRRDLR